MSHHKLEVKNLSFTYPDGHKAIDGISFTVRHGESVGIVGENGAGNPRCSLYLWSSFSKPGRGESG